MTRWEFEQEHGWEEPRRVMPLWEVEPPIWEQDEPDDEPEEGGDT